MSNDPLILRPHHGMCLAYFVGHGYSDGFTAHMAATLASLTPDTPIRLTVNTDTVCTACPNNLGGVCEKPDRVAAYDRAVLDLCGLWDGQVLPFGDLTARVQENILSPGLRPSICGDCRWNGICSTQSSRWA